MKKKSETNNFLENYIYISNCINRMTVLIEFSKMENIIRILLTLNLCLPQWYTR